MDDQILPEQPPPAVQEVVQPTPVQDQQRLDRLEQAMSQLTATVADAANRITNTAPPPPPQTTEQFMAELANNPQETIYRVAAQAARQMTNETLTPQVATVLEMANSQLLAEQAQKVDSELGAGTFDEMFRPQLEKDMAQLKKTDPRAIADRGTIEALTNRLYGGNNFPVLMERRRNLEALAREKGLSHLVPQGGVPRLRGSSNWQEEIPPDVELFLRDVEKTTGENIDRKSYAKLYHTGQDSGPGRHRTGLIEYLKTTGASPDTLKMYGGDRQ